MELKEVLLKTVSNKNKHKIAEISSVLDPNIDYKIEHYLNKVGLDQRMYDLRYNKEFVHKYISTLQGDVILYPQLRINGDFIVVLAILDIQYFNKITRENALIIYEVDDRLFGGTNRC